MANTATHQEDAALYGLSPQQALRLALLRIATDMAPRVTGGVKAEDVVERARMLELYVAGPPPGNAAASGSAEPERGVPAPTATPEAPPATAAGTEAGEQDGQKTPDAGPADPRHGEGPTSAGSAAQAPSA